MFEIPSELSKFPYFMLYLHFCVIVPIATLGMQPSFAIPRVAHSPAAQAATMSRSSQPRRSQSSTSESVARIRPCRTLRACCPTAASSSLETHRWRPATVSSAVSSFHDARARPHSPHTPDDSHRPLPSSGITASLARRGVACLKACSAFSRPSSRSKREFGPPGGNAARLLYYLKVGYGLGYEVIKGQIDVRVVTESYWSARKLSYKLLTMRDRYETFISIVPRCIILPEADLGFARTQTVLRSAQATDPECFNAI
ncbi:hypothetical protein B0H14DRAFT_2586676 [Mycena olivaceomarginata]|nr:hypothetical protein B0H14DRAFT_2586676 [Mycena olivaceomarginata]